MHCQDVWPFWWVCLPAWDISSPTPTQPCDSEGQHSFSVLFLDIVTGIKFTYDCRHLITVSGDRWERPRGSPWLASLCKCVSSTLWGEQELRPWQCQAYNLPAQRALLGVPAFSLDSKHLGVTASPEFKSQICYLFTCDLEQVISPP